MITFNFPEKYLESELNENISFGISTHVDVYDCDYHIIRDPHIIKKFVIELCDKIAMKTFGECLVKDFGEEERENKMLEDKKIYANKIIQTRTVKNGSMEFGTLFTLVIDNDVEGLSTIKSAPYYYIGSTDDVGYFVLAELINERELLSMKLQLMDNDAEKQNNILHFVKKSK